MLRHESVKNKHTTIYNSKPNKRHGIDNTHKVHYELNTQWYTCIQFASFVAAVTLLAGKPLAAACDVTARIENLATVKWSPWKLWHCGGWRHWKLWACKRWRHCVTESLALWNEMARRLELSNLCPSLRESLFSRRPWWRCTDRSWTMVVCPRSNPCHPHPPVKRFKLLTYTLDNKNLCHCTINEPRA